MIAAGFTTTDPFTQTRTTVVEGDVETDGRGWSPIPLQRFVSATIGRLAGALGYHGSHPRFVDG